MLRDIVGTHDVDTHPKVFRPFGCGGAPRHRRDGRSEAHGASAALGGNFADRLSAGLQAPGGPEAVRVARSGGVAGHVEDGATGTIKVILSEYMVVVVL